MKFLPFTCLSLDWETMTCCQIAGLTWKVQVCPSRKGCIVLKGCRRLTLADPRMLSAEPSSRPHMHRHSWSALSTFGHAGKHFCCHLKELEGNFGAQKGQQSSQTPTDSISS